MEDFNKPMVYEKEIDNTNYKYAGRKMCKKKMGKQEHQNNNSEYK